MQNDAAGMLAQYQKILAKFSYQKYFRVENFKCKKKPSITLSLNSGVTPWWFGLTYWYHVVGTLYGD